jgi:hypothetical protein
VTVRVPLHLVELNVGPSAHEFEELVGRRFVLHVERELLDGRLQMASG